MFKELSLKEKGLFSSAFLMMLMLIVRDQLIPPFILLFFISSIPFWKGKRSWNEKKYLLPLMGLFIIYAMSLLFVRNLDQGILSISTKFSFFIFPLIGILMTRGSSVALNGLKWGLITGSLFSMLFSFFRAMIIEKGISGNAFLSDVYGLNMHPSYLALIFLVACAFLWSDKSEERWMKIAKWIFLVVTVISLFYLRSLGAFVCVAAIFGGIPIWKVIQTKNWKWLLTLPIYVLIFIVGLKSSARISNDVSASFDRVGEWSESPSAFIDNHVNDIESNTVRLVVWTMAVEMIVDNPFGVGLGNENNLLVQKYYDCKYTGYAERRLNPHNQFLQSGISIGWIGVIAVLFLFLTMLINTFKVRSLPLFIAVLCLFVSCLFESMLERQVGVIFLSIIVLMLNFASTDKEKSTSK
ncbi:MAG: O-antigen ligase [Crocinitomicaceae bacterium]|jgi:O-antigen ligase